MPPVQAANSLNLLFLYDFTLVLPVIKTVVLVNERRANAVAPLTRSRWRQKSRRPGGIAAKQGRADAGSKKQRRTDRGTDGQRARLSRAARTRPPWPRRSLLPLAGSAPPTPSLALFALDRRRAWHVLRCPGRYRRPLRRHQFRLAGLSESQLAPRHQGSRQGGDRRIWRAQRRLAGVSRRHQILNSAGADDRRFFGHAARRALSHRLG